MLEDSATEIMYMYVDQVILYFVIPFYASINMSSIFIFVKFPHNVSVILILFI